MNEDQSWEGFQLKEPTGKLLGLSTVIMEHICHFLDNRSDIYESCLVHPDWSIAAMATLWEAPRFARPESFRTFLKTISTSKKVALLVRDFHLAFLDGNEDSVFKTIVRSTIERHSATNARPLAKPNLVQYLVRFCENVTDLVCYGWELKHNDWETIAAIVHKLVRLHVIGGGSKPFGMYSFIPKLTSLRLDGQFGIDQNWAAALVNKASNLVDLQLSLENLEFETFMKICTPNALRLKKLTLTNSSVFENSHTNFISSAFPDLNTLCLEGCTMVSQEIILMCLRKFTQLEHLEIRADPITATKTFPTNSDLPYFNIVSPLRKLVIEHLNVNDLDLQILCQLVPHLQILGLKNCNKLTNHGLRHIISNPHIKHLSTLHLVDCPNINSSFLSSNIFTSQRFIKDIYIKSCGFMSPTDIYKICFECYKYRLHSIKVIGYDDLKGSIFDKYNRNHTDTARIVLDTESIKAIATETTPVLCSLSEQRILNDHHILLLAKHFDMSVNDLNTLLDLIENEAKGGNNQEPVRSTLKKRTSRIEALKSSSFPSSPRPKTPTIWSNNFTEYNKTDDTTPTDISNEDTTNKDTTNEKEDQYENRIKQDTGWGFNRSSVTLQQLQKNDITDSWKQKADAFLHPENKKPKADSCQRDGYQMIEGEGWGDPKNIVDWGNYTNQGYVHDLLEEQREKIYCGNEESRMKDSSSDDNINAIMENIAENSKTLKPIDFYSFMDKTNSYGTMTVISSDDDYDSDDSSEKEQISFKVHASNQEKNQIMLYNNFIENTRVSQRTGNSFGRKKNYRAFNNNNGYKQNNDDRIFTKASINNANDQWGAINKSNPERNRTRKTRQDNRNTSKEWWDKSKSRNISPTDNGSSFVKEQDRARLFKSPDNLMRQEEFKNQKEYSLEDLGLKTQDEQFSAESQKEYSLEDFGPQVQEECLSTEGQKEYSLEDFGPQVQEERLSTEGQKEYSLEDLEFKAQEESCSDESEPKIQELEKKEYNFDMFYLLKNQEHLKSRQESITEYTHSIEKKVNDMDSSKDNGVENRIAINSMDNSDIKTSNYALFEALVTDVSSSESSNDMIEGHPHNQTFEEPLDPNSKIPNNDIGLKRLINEAPLTKPCDEDSNNYISSEKIEKLQKSISATQPSTMVTFAELMEEASLQKSFKSNSITTQDSLEKQPCNKESSANGSYTLELNNNNTPSETSTMNLAIKKTSGNDEKHTSVNEENLSQSPTKNTPKMNDTLLDTPHKNIEDTSKWTTEYLKTNKVSLGYVMTARIRVPDNTVQKLHLFKEKNLEEYIKEFCEKYECLHMEKLLNNQLKETYKKKRTDLLLQ